MAISVPFAAALVTLAAAFASIIAGYQATNIRFPSNGDMGSYHKAKLINATITAPLTALTATMLLWWLCTGFQQVSSTRMAFGGIVGILWIVRLLVSIDTDTARKANQEAQKERVRQMAFTA